MASTRTLALLIVAIIGVSVALLEAKSLLSTDGQAEANILGSQLWCTVCRYIAALNAKQLHRIASQVLTVGEALMLSCETTGGRSEEACEAFLSRISEGLGYSLATTGEFVVPTCRVNPFCNTVNSAEPELTDNTFFDIVCGRCKRIAKTALGTTDMVVSEENVKLIFTPFCQGVRFLGRDPNTCIDSLAERFHEVYGNATAVLTPGTVCQLYGLCTFATTPSPPPAVPAPAPILFKTTK